MLLLQPATKRRERRRVFPGVLPRGLRFSLHPQHGARSSILPLRLDNDIFQGDEAVNLQLLSHRGISRRAFRTHGADRTTASVFDTIATWSAGLGAVPPIAYRRRRRIDEKRDQQKDSSQHQKTGNRRKQATRSKWCVMRLLRIDFRHVRRRVAERERGLDLHAQCPKM